MVNRTIRLSKALWLETLKRLPYIIILAVILTFAGGVQSYRKTAEGVNVAKDNSITIKRQSQAIAVLIQQNKDLTKQNNDLARENATQLKCISEIFVDFLNSGGSPSHADVENCQSVLLTSPSTAVEPSTGTKGNASTSPPAKTNQNQTHPVPKSSLPAQQARRVLGVPLCLPATDKCIR